MKERQFWHEFIADLLNQTKQQHSSTSSTLPLLKRQHPNKIQLNKNGIGRQYFVKEYFSNKESDCLQSKIEFVAKIPPVPVLTKFANKQSSFLSTASLPSLPEIIFYESPTILSPVAVVKESFTPPPPSPPATLPKPKSFKLFQASVYSPYCSLDRKFNRNSTYESRYSCFTADNLDKFRRYYAHITSKPRYYSYSVGSTTDDEETNMDDTEDTLTEVSTVNIVIDNANNNTNNDDEDTQTFTSAQDIADDTNDSPTDAKSTQPIEQLNENEQKTVETAETNVLSEENCQQEEKHLKSEELEKKSDVKSPRNSVPNDLMIIKDKPPLQRSLSMPNENNKSMIMLQKSPSRPIFSSSAFYDPEQHPTLEDQVKLCREIAKQLVTDNANEKSKGREMFERRVQKSARWITENEDSFQNYTTNEEDYHERTITDGPPNLRLLLDPRHVEDIHTVQCVNEHMTAAQEAKTRDTCKNIVQDLTSPEVNPNRGNMLFAKRAQKSEDWIVDDIADTVIDAARDKLFRNVKQPGLEPKPIQPAWNQGQSFSQNNANVWSCRSSPIYSPYQSGFNHQTASYQHQSNVSAMPLSTSGYNSRLTIPGPVFSPVSISSPISSRPSSSMSMMLQFKDFNARPKPFCRAY